MYTNYFRMVFSMYKENQETGVSGFLTWLQTYIKLQVHFQKDHCRKARKKKGGEFIGIA